MIVTMPRTIRRWFCRLLIGVFAFAQVAVSAHACSGLAGAAPSTSGPSAAAMQMAADPDRAGDRMGMGGMNMMLSGVCVAHCQDGLPSADQPSSSLPLAVPATLFIVRFLPESSARATSHPEGRTWPSSDPPHAILHCCRRD